MRLQRVNTAWLGLLCSQIRENHNRVETGTESNKQDTVAQGDQNSLWARRPRRMSLSPIAYTGCRRKRPGLRDGTNTYTFSTLRYIGSRSLTLLLLLFS